MKLMNPRITLLLLAGTLPLDFVLAADGVPKPLPFTRYQGMLDRSPFAVATAVAAPVVAPNFAKDLYVANAAKSGEGGLVTIASNADKNFKKYLTTTAPEDGYSISNIEWSDKVGATRVTIAKDGQTATLTFNESLLKQPLAAGQNPVPQMKDQAAALQAQPPQPIVPGVVPPPQQQKPAPVPMLPTPPPRVRGVIQRNPNGNPTTVSPAAVEPEL
jgi:hypothetical protein